jgi:hypothetical protein
MVLATPGGSIRLVVREIPAMEESNHLRVESW